jgi:hypothetical protein
MQIEKLRKQERQNEIETLRTSRHHLRKPDMSPAELQRLITKAIQEMDPSIRGEFGQELQAFLQHMSAVESSILITIDYLLTN